MKLRLRRQKSPSGRRKHPSGEDGYVLFEALLSVVLLSVGIVALTQAFQKSVQAAQFRQHYYGPARELADAVLAELEDSSIKSNLETAGRLYGEGGVFDYEVETSEWPAVPGLVRVSVTVRWTDRGKPGSITLTTLLPVVESATD